MANNSLLIKINRIFALLITAWVCWPWFCQNTGLLGGVFFAGTWCITAFLLSQKHTVGIDGILMSSYAVILVLSFLAFGKVYGTFPVYYYISMVMLFFLPYYMFKFYINRNETDFIGKIAIVAIVFMIIGCLTSSYYTYLNPNIMKTISQSLDTEYVEYRKVGIGSFGFVYMTMLAIIAAIGELKRKSNMPRYMKVSILIFVIIGIKCMIDSTFTTSLLLLIVGIILVLLTNKKIPALNIPIYLLALVTVFLLSSYLGEFLSNIKLESADVTVRLNEIGHFLMGDDLGTHTSGRVDYFWKSIECFLNYPLLGYNFVANPEFSIGGHSEWVDILAVYGLIGGIPLIATIVYKLKYISRTVKSKISNSYYGITIFVFVIFGFIDPFLRLYNLGFAMFFLIPAIGYISELFSKKENEL